MQVIPRWESLEYKLQVKIIENWTDTYVCEAPIWAWLSENFWAITKIDTNWNTVYPINLKTHEPFYWFCFNTNDVLNYEYSYVADLVIPTKVSEDFHLLDTTWWVWTWTITFNKNIFSASDLKFINVTDWTDMWWLVSVSDWLWTDTLTLYFEAPVSLTKIDVFISLKVNDKSWNSSDILSDSYILLTA